MWRLSRLLVIVVILSLGYGSSASALACTDMRPVDAGPATSTGCPDMPKPAKSGRVVACALLCAAIPATSIAIMQPLPVVGMTIVQSSRDLPQRIAPPDPPPPRPDRCTTKAIA
jgi:hypothetical protein